MAATAHLTLVAPDNEKFTVQSAPSRQDQSRPISATSRSQAYGALHRAGTTGSKAYSGTDRTRGLV